MRTLEYFALIMPGSNLRPVLFGRLMIHARFQAFFMMFVAQTLSLLLLSFYAVIVSLIYLIQSLKRLMNTGKLKFINMKLISSELIWFLNNGNSYFSQKILGSEKAASASPLKAGRTLIYPGGKYRPISDGLITLRRSL